MEVTCFNSKFVHDFLPDILFRVKNLCLRLCVSMQSAMDRICLPGGKMQRKKNSRVWEVFVMGTS